MIRSFACMMIAAAAFGAGPAWAQPAPVPAMVVFFPLWSASLDEQAKDVIMQAATQARAKPDAVIKVTGYADTQGSRAADHELSLLRAQRVMDTLEDAGVPESQIQLKADGAQPEAGIASRRVEIVVSAP
jgi:outer membrane protein OmpA-like peptidoglycan-associated protein